MQAVNDDVGSGEYLENRIKGDDLNQRANELAVDSGTNLTSTFVNSGMIVEHRDDGDDKIYEVGNDWKHKGGKGTKILMFSIYSEQSEHEIKIRFDGWSEKTLKEVEKELIK